MKTRARDINLVLIAEDSGRASMLRDTMAQCGINGVIRRIAPGVAAIDCARSQGSYRDKPLPDLFFLDFTEPSEQSTAVLKAIAFGKQRTPVVLLTSAYSQDLLDSGGIGEESAVMFSPTSLSSFVRKMTAAKRASFFKALRTLYQYGPILVRPAEAALAYGRGVTALSA